MGGSKDSDEGRTDAGHVMYPPSKDAPQIAKDYAALEPAFGVTSLHEMPLDQKPTSELPRGTFTFAPTFIKCTSDHIHARDPELRERLMAQVTSAVRAMMPEMRLQTPLEVKHT